MLRAAAGVVLALSSAKGQSVFFSEIRFHNSGAEEGGAFEVTGPAGTSLEGWSIHLYTGNGGAVYEAIALFGDISEQQSGYGAVSVGHADIQNGDDANNGLVLVDDNNNALQFLSYRGTMTATDGPAQGTTSVEIGVAESSTSCSANTSLQLVGVGSSYGEFTWVSDANPSFGEINLGMSITDELTSKGAADGRSTVDSTTTTTTTSTDDGSGDTKQDSTNLHASTDATPDADGRCARSNITPISAIQGTGTETPMSGQTVTVRATVTSVFPGLSGFFVQDRGDGNSASSDGIFIYQGSTAASVPVAAGDLVTVSGEASEYYSNTQITVDSVERDIEIYSSHNQLPKAVEISLPSDEETLESLEGMLVSVKRPVVTENYNAGKFGEITVAADRLWQYTQINEPGNPTSVAIGTAIIIDDGHTGFYPDPNAYVDRASTIRVGQTLNDIRGILAEGFGSRRIHPVSRLSVALATNPRPTEIPREQGNLRVASFNVLNYFTTLNSRGASTEELREEQLAKITEGALALNADVIGIVEVENDYDADTPSIQAIVNSINSNSEDEEAGWSYVIPSLIPLGEDDIAVGIIYDSNRVTTKGSSGVLDYADGKTRASLAQTFEAKKCDEREVGREGRKCPALTLVVNHFKSKGSDCDDVDDPDIGDGQGNCNLTRTAAMEKLLAWISGSESGVSADSDILLAGDFNSYAKEDPIQVAATLGFVDMASTNPAYPKVSSYVFKGESGTLDYILASGSAVSQTVGELVHYHVNADETSALEYDNCGTNAACNVSLDQYRCSDHDMVVQDFELV